MMVKHIISADKDIPAKCLQWCGAAIADAYAGTTGLAGGDWGHGGRAAFGFRDQGGLGFQVVVDGKKVDCDEVMIVFGGDDEIHFCEELLQFAADTIKEQLNDDNDC
jgi:hypothetical protein